MLNDGKPAQDMGNPRDGKVVVGWPSAEHLASAGPFCHTYSCVLSLLLSYCLVSIFTTITWELYHGSTSVSYFSFQITFQVSFIAKQGN